LDDRGIRHFVVRKTRAARPLSQIYRNPRIHREQGQVLDSFHPDVVHLQHLMGLSVDLPTLAQARGVPVAMTVHDAWLQCAAGGQRFRRSLGRYDAVSLERCGECTAHLSTPAMQVNALLNRMGVRVGAPIELSSLDAASGSASPREREAWTVRCRHVSRFKAHESSTLRATSAHHQSAPHELPETAKHFGDLGEIARHQGAYSLIDAAELRALATYPGIRASPSQGHSPNAMFRNTCKK
jgi:hypothetical protein